MIALGCPLESSGRPGSCHLVVAKAAHRVPAMGAANQGGEQELGVAPALHSRRSLASLPGLRIGEGGRGPSVVTRSGGYGYSSEYDMERLSRSTLAAAIYGGTSEIQRGIIPRRSGSDMATTPGRRNGGHGQQHLAKVDTTRVFGFVSGFGVRARLSDAIRLGGDQERGAPGRWRAKRSVQSFGPPHGWVVSCT